MSISQQHLPRPVHVIGGGLAGSEAAWQIASAGVPVVLHEMRPVRKTDAHQTDGLAEMVCSNSFRSDDAEYNAVGLLHEEMRRCGSLILRCADAIAEAGDGDRLFIAGHSLGGTLATVFSSLLIGTLLERLGTPGVLTFIVASMLIVVLTIGLFGPRTRNRALEDIAR